jgi:DNA-directed RNA polymerase specialized sigma54-like protein
MSWLQPKLHLRVAQKQILTPGLVQMVSVLALNRLELREMINQEMVANPVLEELTDDSVTGEDYMMSSMSPPFSTSTWTREGAGNEASARKSSAPRSKSFCPRRKAFPNI